MKTKFTIPLFLISVLTGCSLGPSGIDFKEMESSEAEYKNYLLQNDIAFMSLETMFPQKEVRDLAKAAGNGKTSRIEELVKQGIDVNARGKKNTTVLFWAFRNNNFNGFSRLLQLGANPNVIFEDGGSVMHLAASVKIDSYLAVALKYGGDPNLVSGGFLASPVVFDAIHFYGDDSGMANLMLLLDAGADLHATSKRGQTLLISAAEYIRFDIVFELLEQGVDYEQRNHLGQILADILPNQKKLMDTSHVLYSWVLKVEDWLRSKGVQM